MASGPSDHDAAGGSVSRRDFLRVGGLSMVGLSVAEQTAAKEQQSAGHRPEGGRRNCIFLLMTGGPSPFETFDPKPQARSDVRGPLRSISTSIPGVAFSESLPRLAQRAGSLAVVRSLCHDAAPIHETGLQLLLTGCLKRGERCPPCFGSVVSRYLGPRGETPPFVVLPQLLSNTGVNAYQGQRAGVLGTEFDPLVVSVSTSPAAINSSHAENGNGRPVPVSWDGEPEPVRRCYGDTRAGRLCLAARQLVEQGVRVVLVNLFDALAGELTWDCHGRNSSLASGTLFDYRDTLCPHFDRAASALLDDLQERGLWEDTLVVAAGEMGRTPRINTQAGRDHWPGVWSAILAGGGIQGGQVIGSSDAQGIEPLERPVQPAELTATIYHAFGLDAAGRLCCDGADLPSIDAEAIAELFA